MNTAFIVMIVGAVLYLLLGAVGKYNDVKDLAGWAFAAGLLAWLLGGVR